jgi:hypothetical protein
MHFESAAVWRGNLSIGMHLRLTCYSRRLAGCDRWLVAERLRRLAVSGAYAGLCHLTVRGSPSRRIDELGARVAVIDGQMKVRRAPGDT